MNDYASARSLRRRPIRRGPLRKIVEYGAGTSKLECGHSVDTPKGFRGRDPPAGTVRRCRCEVCLPVEDRLDLAKQRRQSE